MTKFSIKILSGVLIALILLSFIDRYSGTKGSLRIVGIWIVKSLNLSTTTVLPFSGIHVHKRIKVDTLITQHLQKNHSLYAKSVAKILANKQQQSLPFEAALGLASTIKEDPQVAEQLAIIARQHPRLKVRCYWQAQLSQGTIITMVNSPGPNQVTSQYLVMPEIQCPAKALNLAS